MHTKRPDLDKLLRATFDAVTATGRVWADDSQVVKVTAEKLYTPSPSDVGTLLEVTFLNGGSHAI
jgi:Holliday junction resolvase RusA-like endonuclease